MPAQLDRGRASPERVGVRRVSDHTTGPAARIDELAEIARVVAAFLAAFAALDWEAFRRCFADEATVFFPSIDHPQRAAGREQIEQVFHDVFERARAGAAGPPYLDLQPRDLSIRHTGDVALVTFHLNDPGILCRRTLILQRMAAGWRIVHLHASNLPAPAAQDLSPS
jgi:ketosteroid isomerase-like protein